MQPTGPRSMDFLQHPWQQCTLSQRLAIEQHAVSHQKAPPRAGPDQTQGYCCLKDGFIEELRLVAPAENALQLNKLRFGYHCCEWHVPANIAA